MLFDKVCRKLKEKMDSLIDFFVLRKLVKAAIFPRD